MPTHNTQVAPSSGYTPNVQLGMANDDAIKDKKIAKAVALKAAVDGTNKDAPVDIILEIAERYYEWLTKIV